MEHVVHNDGTRQRSHSHNDTQSTPAPGSRPYAYNRPGLSVSLLLSPLYTSAHDQARSSRMKAS
jgi:hypothetical protein